VAVEGGAERLGKRGGVDVGRRQRRLAEIGAGKGKIVVVTQQIDIGRRQTHLETLQHGPVGTSQREVPARPAGLAAVVHVAFHSWNSSGRDYEEFREPV